MSEKNKSVMGNLPSTRPTRMGRRREGGDGAAAATEAPKPAAPRKPRAATSASQRKTAAATKPKPAAAAKAKRKAAAKPKAASGPRAVRSGSPSLKSPTAKDARRKPREARPPKGAELVTTAVQATGELAQIGVKLGARAVKRAVDRLPKP